MWNAQRTQALYRTFYQMLYPLFAKELEEKLLHEAKDFVIKVGVLAEYWSHNMRDWPSLSRYDVLETEQKKLCYAPILC
jgi:hypothetical protein